jgi:hypothetical protein
MNARRESLPADSLVRYGLPEWPEIWSDLKPLSEVPERATILRVWVPLADSKEDAR